jgi:pimeloyl-ACP methyl ester carboxylesterase
MNDDFVICARAVERNKFIAEPGVSRFLSVPDGELPKPTHAVKRQDVWIKRVRKEAVWGKDSRDPRRERGDVLVFVHGYNNDQDIVMKRHRRLKADLIDAGYMGTVISFDWPSDNKTLNYLEDRHDAKQTAMQLVTDCIRALAKEQTPNCTINVHLLGHSTGAYVIREAFDDADDANFTNNSWVVSQLAFIGGDISASSLSEDESSTESLYRHCIRLTNYSNLRDSVLKLSNTKRLGMASRVGRVGLPEDAPSKALNVDCTEYFEQLDSDATIKDEDQHEELGTFSHSWHIGNKIFTRDLFETLKGDLDRNVLPTRTHNGDGELVLHRPG